MAQRALVTAQNQSKHRGTVSVKEALLHNGRSIANTYDAIGRITSRTLKYGSTNILKTDLTYVSGANGSKTALVSSLKNGNDSAYNYSYDANGNITQIWRGSGTFSSASEKYSYVYDKANQLIRENLYYGSGNTNNATYTYTYDEWGNLLEKNKYAYTTGTVGSVLDTVTYGYTDSEWGDKLTSYDGNTITYDAMGNPTSYLGKTLTWEGKQLKTAARNVGALTIQYSYEYDENGLRTNKTTTIQSSGPQTTEYYYNGSVLIGMRIDVGYAVKLLKFSYDANGTAVAVDYSEDNGSTYTTYYYVRNAQNDVVKLIDGTGSAVVEYTYDTWGKILSVSGSLATALGYDQPFRYRGYVYDNETQWYYLQSRYYDPTTCRFISADVLLSTGQGVLGHNAFAYCLNNPVNMADEGGCRALPFATMMADTGKSGWNIVYYNVPVYNQGDSYLCWAFCQVMIESYNLGVTLTQQEATNRAISIAKEVNGVNDWNKGGFPQYSAPLGISINDIDSIYSLYQIIRDYGPMYAYYENTRNGNTHLVVVTGVDADNNIVYTNNPWGERGKQTFEDFLTSIVWKNNLERIYRLKNIF